jgi:hypothetical protein
MLSWSAAVLIVQGMDATHPHRFNVVLQISVNGAPCGTTSDVVEATNPCEAERIALRA